MMRHLRFKPEINTGSMADIAFLLLIFFLVTATITTDQGINRLLPKDCPTGTDCSMPIHERNILRVMINNNNDIMVDDELITLKTLKGIAKAFLDNNGDGTCGYCHGNNLNSSSDNPQKAVISLQNGKQTSYKAYIAVQDELTKAYYELRRFFADSEFNKPIDKLNKEELKRVKEAYPFILSEATTK